MRTRIKLLSVALVAIMALTVMSSAALVTAQGSLAPTLVSVTSTPQPAVVGIPVTVSVTFSVAAGATQGTLVSLQFTWPDGSMTGTSSYLPGGTQTVSTTWTPTQAGTAYVDIVGGWTDVATNTGGPMGPYAYSFSVISTQQTQLSATVAPAVVAVNHPFWINGTLSTTANTPVAGAAVQLQQYVSGAWTNVAGATATTTPTGAYSISTSEPTAGTYQYQTTYAGNATYAGSTSNSVSVKVVSKTSVLQDYTTLLTTMNQLPNSAFLPGTKLLLLAAVGVSDLQARANDYGAAAATLQLAVLPHMDGCSATGSPNSNDWVRTCAAQGQLYPQVQNLIQELQALQHS